MSTTITPTLTERRASLFRDIIACEISEQVYRAAREFERAEETHDHEHDLWDSLVHLQELGG